VATVRRATIHRHQPSRHEVRRLAHAPVRVLGFLRTAGDAVRDRARRLVGRARTLTPRQVFAAVFVILVLLYLFVLLVEPTGAGRGGR